MKESYLYTCIYERKANYFLPHCKVFWMIILTAAKKTLVSPPMFTQSWKSLSWTLSVSTLCPLHPTAELEINAECLRL